MKLHLRNSREGKMGKMIKNGEHNFWMVYSALVSAYLHGFEK